MTKREIEKRLERLEADTDDGLGLDRSAEEYPPLSIAEIVSYQDREMESLGEADGYLLFRDEESGEIQRFPADVAEDILDSSEDDS